MDIGNITLKKTQNKDKSLNITSKKRRKSETTLPSLTVKRNL